MVGLTTFGDFILTDTVSKFRIFASKISRDVRTLDSLRGAKPLVGAEIFESFGSAFGNSIFLRVCLSEILGGCLGISTGERTCDFLRDQGMAEPMDPQIEEAFVFVDLIEDASDSGDDWPDDDAEYKDGLSGRIDDSEIQSRSVSAASQPLQSLLDDNTPNGN